MLFFIFTRPTSVIIDAGPRYEKNYLSGVTHFLEKLSFNVSLNNFKNLETLFIEVFYFNSHRLNMKTVTQ